MPNSHHRNHEPAFSARLEKAYVGNIDSKMKRRSVMKVGFIGAGNVTRTIGRHLINAGHAVVVSNSRDPETLSEFLGSGRPRGDQTQVSRVRYSDSRDALGECS